MVPGPDCTVLINQLDGRPVVEGEQSRHRGQSLPAQSILDPQREHTRVLHRPGGFRDFLLLEGDSGITANLTFQRQVARNCYRLVKS